MQFLIPLPHGDQLKNTSENPSLPKGTKHFAAHLYFLTTVYVLVTESLASI